MRSQVNLFLYQQRIIYLLKFMVSSSVKNVMALPGLPARPVLPKTWNKSKTCNDTSEYHY